MSTATSDLCGYEQLIIAEVGRAGTVIGKRNLIVRVLNLPGRRWAEQCVDRLRERGMLSIRATGPGRPLIITAKAGRHVR